MTIPKYLQDNFNVIIQAALVGDLCIMECRHKKTGELHPVLCVTEWSGGGRSATIKPCGLMFKFSDESEEPAQLFDPPYEEDGTPIDFDQTMWMVPPSDQVVSRG